MRKKDNRNAQRLKDMLGEESPASLSDILGIVAKMPHCDEDVESFKAKAPVDVLHGYFAVRNELWGISERYFWELNSKVSENDFYEYFRCIEALPDIKVAGNVIRLMVWGMGKEDRKDALSAFASQMPPFLSRGKWNGSVSVFLAMRGAIDCVDYKQEGQTNVVLSIVRNRRGLERTVAAIAAISLVVRELSGNLDEEGWRGTDRHSRQIQLLDLYRSLEEENKEHLKTATFHVIAPLLFGLDIEHDWKDTENCRNAGLPSKTGIFSYAEAIIVACASGILLTREECVKVCTLAFYCADPSHMWRQKSFRQASLFMADLIAGMDESKAIWRDIHNNVRHLIHRGLYEYRTGATESLSDRLEIFVGTAFVLVCDFCNKRRMEDAMDVWAPAWIECVTALYAFPLVNGFMALIQYFFVKAGLYFTNESELVPSGVELLGQLPLLEMRPGERIDCAEACVNVLKDNLDEVSYARMCEKDPDLARLVDGNVLKSQPE